MRATPVLTAATATIVFVGTLGLLLVVAGFGLIRIGDEMLEALGILSARWGENNLGTLLGLAAVVSAPAVAWFGAWFYKRALAAEIRLEGVNTAPVA